MRPASLLDDAARLKGTSDVAHPVWPMATHKGELTATRLVITFVPTTGMRSAGGVRRFRCPRWSTAEDAASRSPLPPPPYSAAAVTALAVAALARICDPKRHLTPPLAHTPWGYPTQESWRVPGRQQRVHGSRNPWTLLPTPPARRTPAGSPRNAQSDQRSSEVFPQVGTGIATGAKASKHRQTPRTQYALYFDV